MDSEINNHCCENDRSLIDRTLHGDLNAFDELVQRYHAPLISFLKFYSPPNCDVEDVAQEAFLKCFTRLEQFDKDRKFKNWLYTIARRTIPCLQTQPASNAENLEHLIDDSPDPHRLAENDDQNHCIWSTVRNTTTDDEFQLMWFRYAETLSIKEIATLMQRSENALKMQLSRLRKRLRNHLQPFVDSTAPNDLFTQSEKVA